MQMYSKDHRMEYLKLENFILENLRWVTPITVGHTKEV